MYTHTLRISTTGLFVGAAMLGMLLNPFAAIPAHAQTTQSVEAQIQQLLTQIAALQAQLNNSTGAGTGVSYSFTRNLTIGSTGADVTVLQQFLIGKGHTIPAGATGYFGQQTQGALAAFQAANGIAPAVGYFGPITRTHITSITPAPGTPAPGTGDTGSGLQGGAGSIDTFKLTTGFNNEEVGEDENDVEVAGLDIKAAQSSDIKLTAVQVTFDEGTATTRFSKYADEVSFWLEGKEIARVDASDFTDRNNWTRTITLSGDTIIKRGDTATLTVAISGLRNLDSAYEGHTWTIDFQSIRFQDAQGSSITEQVNTDTRTFSFESFATASDVELRIKDGDDEVNDSRVINVHATNKTRNVDVLSFDIDVRGDSDVTIDSLPITFTVTGAADLSTMASAAHLYMNGKRVGSENTKSGEDIVVFDRLDLELDAGKTYEFLVKVDFLALSGTLDEGQTIAATFGETETDSANFDAEDAAGNDLTDAAKNGTARGGAHVVYDVGLKVSLVETGKDLTSRDGNDDDLGTFSIKYRVESFDGTVYLSLNPAVTASTTITDTTTTGAAVLYFVEKGGSPTTDNVTANVSWKKVSGSPTTSGVSNGLRLKEGDAVEITLTVVRSNSGDVDDNGFYEAALKAIGWNTNDSSTFNLYTLDLDAYKSGSLYLN